MDVPNLPGELDKSSANKDAIRGREQQVMDANGKAQSDGGTSGNKIRGIAEDNPKADQYMNAAQEEFGSAEGAAGAAEGAEGAEAAGELLEGLEVLDAIDP